VGSAFAIENDVSRFSDAFSFTPLRFFAATFVCADLVAMGNLLLGHADILLLNINHRQSPLDSLLGLASGNAGSS
jgi:hypothetical protein